MERRNFLQMGGGEVSTRTLAVWVVALAALPLFGSDTYKIDPHHSKIGFTVPHIVISKVDGRFKSLEGTIVLDAQDMTKSSVEVTIKTDSVDTGVAKRDSDLHYSELLDVAKYPDICFKSTKIKKRDNHWVAVGNFTLKDVTKQIELPFTLEGPVTDLGGKSRIAIHASAKINRHEYHVGYNIRLKDGAPVIGEEVTIDLQVEATKP
jgi:polyisoprenoid-binding protein YceI